MARHGGRPQWHRRLGWAVGLPIVLIAGGAGAAQGQAFGGTVCQKCHADRPFLRGKGSTTAHDDLLYVPDSVLADTRHQTLACRDCHVEYDAGYPHRATSVAIGCADCHAEEGAAWSVSIHAQAENGDAATCVACHSAHTVYGADDRRSPTHPLNVADACAVCHSDPRIIGMYFEGPGAETARGAVGSYYQTVHGAAVTQSGLIVSATCNDCHGAHDVLPATSPESRVNRRNLATTCGSCHTGVVEVFRESAHGHSDAVSDGDVMSDVTAPTCGDCHEPHRIVRTDEPSWFIGMAAQCGSCHERVYETYFQTYHGQVTQLGFGLTAKCSDCHTAHDIRTASDPLSSVYPLNIVDTCAQCHSGANANFAKYYTHGDMRDRERYPVLFWPWLLMTTLLVSVWTFFGVHTAMWFSGLAIERHRERRAGRAEAPPA